ncbi:MAG: hypothetical protein M1546_05575 [Chloroflexi bacterium]|nr:hypothetical protein [Chloroflexota bacterium]
MITTAEFLYITAAILSIIAAFLIITAYFGARRGQRAAYYSTRREAHRQATRRASTGLTMFVIAAGLAIVGKIIPSELVQPAPDEPPLAPPSVIVETVTPPAQPTVFIVPSSTPAPTRTPEPTRTPRTTTAHIIIPTKTATATIFDKHMTLSAISSAVDAAGQPISPTTEFTQGVSTIYIFFDYQDLPKGALLRHTWFHDGGSVHFESITWTEPESGVAHVSWSPPKGFEAGLYEVRLLLGNTKQFTANFIVR